MATTKPARTKRAPAKRAAAKKAPAAASPRRRAPRPPARELVHAAGGTEFWMTDGTILRNLHELAEALETMAAEVYAYHVTREKHDFADWVEAVLEDAECAAALRKSRKPGSAHTVVVRSLKRYAR